MRAAGICTPGGAAGGPPPLDIAPWAHRPDVEARTSIALAMENRAREAYRDAAEGRGTRAKDLPGGPKPPNNRRPRQPGDRGVPRFGPADAVRIRVAYEAGATVAALAADHGCGQTAIVSAIRNAGGTTRDASARQALYMASSPAGMVVNQDAIDTIVEMYTGGGSIASICEALGIGHRAVKGALRRAGVPRRSRSEVTRISGPHTARAEARADRAARWAEMSAQGMTYAAIAAADGATVDQIGKTLRAHGLAPGAAHNHKRQPTPLTPDQTTTAITAYADGQSLDTIARAAGVHATRVRAALVAAGVDIRPPSVTRRTQ